MFLAVREIDDPLAGAANLMVIGGWAKLLRLLVVVLVCEEKLLLHVGVVDKAVVRSHLLLGLDRVQDGLVLDHESGIGDERRVGDIARLLGLPLRLHLVGLGEVELRLCSSVPHPPGSTSMLVSFAFSSYSPPSPTHPPPPLPLLPRKVSDAVCLRDAVCLCVRFSRTISARRSGINIFVVVYLLSDHDGHGGRSGRGRGRGYIIPCGSLPVSPTRRTRPDMSGRLSIYPTYGLVCWMSGMSV